ICKTITGQRIKADKARPPGTRQNKGPAAIRRVVYASLSIETNKMINEIFATGIKLKIVDRTDSEKIHLLRTNPSVAKFITRNLDLSVADIENLIEERLSDLENILFYKIETLPDLELA